MPNVNETVEVARKVLPIVYVLDTSGSMTGDRIAAVNEAMNETMEVLRDVSAHNPDAEIKVGVLKFSTNAEWVTNGLVFMDDFFWNDLEAGGTTEVATALNALHNKLSRSEFLVSDTGFCIPVLIFMSDGEPTDPGVWESKLEWVKNNNKWFKYATKIAIAVGDDADKNCLAKLVGNSEAVVAVNDLATLKALIKVASMTASMINSKSRTTAEGGNAVDIINQTKKMLDDPDSVQVGTDGADPWNNWDQQSSGTSTTNPTSGGGDWGGDDDGGWN